MARIWPRRTPVARRVPCQSGRDPRPSRLERTRHGPCLPPQRRDFAAVTAALAVQVTAAPAVQVTAAPAVQVTAAWKALVRPVVRGDSPVMPVATVPHMQKWEYVTVPVLIHSTKVILDNWGEDGG